MLTKEKWYRFAEFSSIWIGFCFTIISISSYQWLVSGSCCRSGLFVQCGDGGGGCACTGLPETFSWMQASEALGILSTIFSGVALILYLVADIKFQRRLKRRIRIKFVVLTLVAVADFFILVSAAVFAAHNSELMTSLSDTHPGCSSSLQYGYGFIIAWFAFIFFSVGVGMAYVNIRINKS